MKKNIIYIIIFVQALFSSQMVCAQQNNTALQRLIVDEAISTIEDYEACATISDDEVRYSFLELFVDENAPVYNDLLGLSTEEALSASEYSRMLSNGVRNKNISISNICKERVWNDDGLWKVLFSLDKSITYLDNCGTYFSNKEFYDKEYRLEAILVYDENVGKCKIEEIKGTIDSSKRLPEKFKTFKSEDERDNWLKYNGTKLSFNSYRQAFLTSGINKKSFKYVDSDVKITPVLDDCGNISMKYKARKVRLKAHYDFGLGEGYKLDDDALFTDTKTSLNNMGLDFGFIIPSKAKLKVGIFMGVGFSQSKIDLAYDTPDYAYTTSADVDGDSYTRHYQGLSLSQSIKMTDLTVPVYFDFNCQFGRIVNLYVDLGVKLNLNMNHKVDTTEGGAYIYGIYPQYSNLRMDEHWGYNGFGERSFSASMLDNEDLLDVASFTTDAFAGAGLRFNIPNSPITIDLGVNYQLGLMDVIKANPNMVSLNRVSSSSNALVYNTISGTESVEHVRNLTESLSSVKRQSLFFSAGLIFKF